MLPLSTTVPKYVPSIHNTIENTNHYICFFVVLFGVRWETIRKWWHFTQGFKCDFHRFSCYNTRYLNCSDRGDHELVCFFVVWMLFIRWCVLGFYLNFAFVQKVMLRWWEAVWFQLINVWRMVRSCKTHWFNSESILIRKREINRHR